MVRFQVLATKEISGAAASVILSNKRRERVTTLSTLDQRTSIDLGEGVGEYVCRIEGLPLAPGRYTLTTGIALGIHVRACDVIVNYPAFEIVMPGIESGEIEWPTRPWGCVHWRGVTWQQATAPHRYN